MFVGVGFLHCTGTTFSTGWRKQLQQKGARRLRSKEVEEKTFDKGADPAQEIRSNEVEGKIFDKGADPAQETTGRNQLASP